MYSGDQLIEISSVTIQMFSNSNRRVPECDLGSNMKSFVLENAMLSSAGCTVLCERKYLIFYFKFILLLQVALWKNQAVCTYNTDFLVHIRYYSTFSPDQRNIHG
uniref:Uncharacterized protein n=1 Tax=Cacopsylla melanoneura TaxID=428564 RepID=A0A8D9E7I6_9HEMI